MYKPLLLALLTSAVGCKHHVNTSFLQAAAIDIPNQVQTVVVIDRSRPKNFGENVLAAAEGGLTGETVWLDAESAAIALNTLQDELAYGPRFQIVRFQVDGREVDTSMWDRALAAEKVRKLCAEARCDAVIALESLDSDTATTIEREGNRYTAAEREAAKANGDCQDRACAGDYEYDATQYTDVVATFRMYDGRTGVILDEQSATYSTTDTASDADRAGDALQALPSDARVYDGAATLGASYANRISPHEVYATRRLFSKGHPELKAGRIALQNGDAQGAMATWTALLDAGGDVKLRRKVLHNLAVGSEMLGDVPSAINYATRASKGEGLQASYTYLRELKSRQDNDQAVARQLAPPAPPAVDPGLAVGALPPG